MDNFNAQEWIFLIVVAVALIAVYVNREKIRSRFGGKGKGNDGPPEQRK